MKKNGVDSGNSGSGSGNSGSGSGNSGSDSGNNGSDSGSGRLFPVERVLFWVHPFFLQASLVFFSTRVDRFVATLTCSFTVVERRRRVFATLRSCAGSLPINDRSFSLPPWRFFFVRPRIRFVFGFRFFCDLFFVLPTFLVLFAECFCFCL